MRPLPKAKQRAASRSHCRREVQQVIFEKYRIELAIRVRYFENTVEELFASYQAALNIWRKVREQKNTFECWVVRRGRVTGFFSLVRKQPSRTSADPTIDIDSLPNPSTALPTNPLNPSKCPLLPGKPLASRTFRKSLSISNCDADGGGQLQQVPFDRRPRRQEVPQGRAPS